MVAPFIDEALPDRVDVGRAVRIATFVVGHRAGGHDDQAVPRMRVPSRGAARLPDVRLDVHIGGALGLLARLPDVGRNLVQFYGDLREPSQRHRGSDELARGRSLNRPGIHASREYHGAYEPS